jgi:3-oxoacyl-[acyl-carrier protein] reductase
MKLERRIAIVTGAARGIGRAIAGRLAQDGAHVVVMDRDGAAARAAGADLLPAGKATHAVLDIRDIPAMREALSTIVSEFGPPSILVNNAGVVDNVPFLETSEETFDTTVDVNFRGLFFLSQEFARTADPNGGAIVNIASVTGLFGSERRSVYGPTKAAVIALTKAMAVELAPRRIRVNAVAPGAVETSLSAEAHGGEWRRLLMSRTPAGRYGSPEEIAAAVLFLVSDDASFITGHTINVDGGFAAAGIFSPPAER